MVPALLSKAEYNLTDQFALESSALTNSSALTYRQKWAHLVTNAVCLVVQTLTARQLLQPMLRRANHVLVAAGHSEAI